MILNDLFKKHPENLPKSVIHYRVWAGSAVVPVSEHAGVQEIFACRPVATNREWYVKADDLFVCPNVQFVCAEAPEFHRMLVSERFHNPADSYLVRLPNPFPDSWRTKTIVGFILFAQDLIVYR
jgi:hypothetical protein